MRGTVHPGGLTEILLSEEEARALWPANGLAAAVAHERGAARQVNVRVHGEDFRRGIDQHGHIVRCGGGANGFGRHRARFIGRAGHEVNHRGPWTERQPQRFGGIDLDDFDPERAYGRVVLIAGGRGNDDLVLGKTAHVRQAHVHLGIAAGEARGRRVGNRRRAPGADHAPLGARQLGQPLARSRREFVQVRVLLVGQRLDGLHLRKLDVAAEDRERTARVDQRADAERLIRIDGGGGGRRRSLRGRLGHVGR